MADVLAVQVDGVPDNHELVRIGFPRDGEQYLSEASGRVETRRDREGGWRHGPRLIVRPVVATQVSYYVLVWMPSGVPVVPQDENPGFDDQGMLVYRSREAAEASAARQDASHGEDRCETATAIPLSQLGLKLTEQEGQQ